LKQPEYSELVLGLISLRFPEVRFSAQRANQPFNANGKSYFNACQVKFRTNRPALTWRELSTFMGLAANRELITRFEQKIHATLARIWGEEAPAALEA
jgi:hypothetical protein